MSETQTGHWTFLTNHAHILILLARHKDILLKDAAQLVGITERAAQRILDDLVSSGYVTRTRVGRRNTYEVNEDRSFRHPLEQHVSISVLIHLPSPPQEQGSSTKAS